MKVLYIFLTACFLCFACSSKNEIVGTWTDGRNYPTTLTFYNNDTYTFKSYTGNYFYDTKGKKGYLKITREGTQQAFEFELKDNAMFLKIWSTPFYKIK